MAGSPGGAPPPSIGGRGRPARGGDDEAFPRKGQGAHPSPGRRTTTRSRTSRPRAMPTSSACPAPSPRTSCGSGSRACKRIRSRTKVTHRVLEAADRLIGVGCFCIGTDQVDLAEARQRGVPVFNAPFSNTRSVAELVLGLMIMLMRGIFPKSKRRTAASGSSRPPTAARQDPGRSSATAISAPSSACWPRRWACG